MKKLSLIADTSVSMKVCKNTAAVLQNKDVLVAAVVAVAIISAANITVTYLRKD